MDFAKLQEKHMQYINGLITVEEFAEAVSEYNSIIQSHVKATQESGIDSITGMKH